MTCEEFVPFNDLWVGGHCEITEYNENLFKLEIRESAVFRIIEAAADIQ
jgi:hypothetical protein